MWWRWGISVQKSQHTRRKLSQGRMPMPWTHPPSNLLKFGSFKYRSHYPIRPRHLPRDLKRLVKRGGITYASHAKPLWVPTFDSWRKWSSKRGKYTKCPLILVGKLIQALQISRALPLYKVLTIMKTRKTERWRWKRAKFHISIFAVSWPSYPTW